MSNRRTSRHGPTGSPGGPASWKLACAGAAIALAAACERAPPGKDAIPSTGAVSAAGAPPSLTLTPPAPVQSIALHPVPPGAGEAARGSLSRRTPVVEAVAKAAPSVVSLGTERIVKTIYNVPLLARRAALLDPFFREVLLVPMPPQTRVTHSLGSGVIVDERGYILTNNHVIDRASRVRVVLDNNESYDASFVAADEVDDLALIKIDTGTNRPLRAIELVDGDELFLGETVIAMGNPFGLSQSVSVGVLSATNRPATYRGELLYRDILQTDAAVNFGSSGGPLLNIEGKLIGVNVAVYDEAQNIGFAQPVHRVRQLLGRWLSPQVLKKQWLGFSVEQDGRGVRVAFMPTNSPAREAGLPLHAVIQAVNGVATPDLLSFNRQLLGLEEGREIGVTWSLDGLPRTSRLTVLSSGKQNGNELAWQRLGLRLAPSVGSAVIPLRYQKSLPVEAVAADGPAARAGLEPGRYIWRINEAEIRNLDDVAMALANVQRGDRLSIGLADFLQNESTAVIRQSQVELVAN